MNQINWDEKDLGIVSDAQLARDNGVNKSTVQIARIERCIEACGNVSDKSKYLNGVVWEDMSLGERSDTQIAMELDCSTSTVKYHRERLGIAPYYGCVYKTKGINWDDVACNPRFDRLSIRSLAKTLGVSKTTVYNAFLRRGIRFVR